MMNLLGVIINNHPGEDEDNDGRAGWFVVWGLGVGGWIRLDSHVLDTRGLRINLYLSTLIQCNT